MNEALFFLAGLIFGSALTMISAGAAMNRLHRETDEEIERIYAKLKRREQNQP